MIRSVIAKALSSEADTAAIPDNPRKSVAPTQSAATSKDVLPTGKKYAYFASHKKQHSRFGDASADLARALKDILLLKFSLEGYFDADNLVKINKQQLTRGVIESCSVLLYLNDETLDSEWCRHEVGIARSFGIPIIVLIDA